jgi:hypothetical protein
MRFVFMEHFRAIFCLSERLAYLPHTVTASSSGGRPRVNITDKKPTSPLPIDGSASKSGFVWHE